MNAGRMANSDGTQTPQSPRQSLNEDTPRSSTTTLTSVTNTERNSSEVSSLSTAKEADVPTQSLLSPDDRFPRPSSRSYREALRSHTLSHSRSPSRLSGTSGEVPNQWSLESVIGTGKGVSRIVGVGLKSPLDFTMGLAQGFHNAPKLYGDDTVRQQDKITGIHSGLKAAGMASTTESLDLRHSLSVVPRKKELPVSSRDSRKGSVA